MPATVTMIGAVLGLGTQMYSNALRKLPYMRRKFLISISFHYQFNWINFVTDPWEHVLGMGIGAVFANQLVKWDAKLQVDLDIMLEKAKAANESRYFGIILNPNFFFLSELWLEIMSRVHM